MWRLGTTFADGWSTYGAITPAKGLSRDFRRGLDALLDQDAAALESAVEEASSHFVEAERQVVRDPAVEETFRRELPPTLPMLIGLVATAAEVRDAILEIDVRWQLDAVHVVEEYVSDKLTARKLGAQWKRLKPENSQVDVHIASVERAWVKSEDFWLVLKTEHTDQSLVTEAADEADRLAATSGLETPLKMWIEPCPGGFAVEIGPALLPHAVCHWISFFVQGLDARGVTGHIAGTARR